jgi:tetratricopeptide (TPR) repeat protein
MCWLLADRAAEILKQPMIYRLRMARLYIDKKDPNSALEVLQNVLVETKNSHIDALFLKGELMESGGFFSVASECYARIMELQPKNVEAVLRKAKIHFRFGEHKVAKALFEKVLALSPGHKEARLYLDAIAAGKTTVDIPKPQNTPAPPSPAPDASTPSPSPSSAAPASSPSPSSTGPVSTPSPASCAPAQSPSSSPAAGFALPSLTPSTSSADAAEHFRKGEEARLEGQVEKAIVYYEEALKIDPNFVEAHLAAGFLYWRTGQTGKAMFEMNAVTQLTDRYVSAYYLLGKIYESAHEERGYRAYLEKAEECYAKVAACEPGNAEARMDLERVRKKLGK